MKFDWYIHTYYLQYTYHMYIYDNIVSQVQEKLCGEPIVIKNWKKNFAIFTVDPVLILVRTIIPIMLV